MPEKGRALTAISAFWFDELAGVLPNHVVDQFPDVPDEWKGLATLARRADMLKIECIVRGYLSGSAWQEYKKSGTINGVPLPAGMQESEKLPVPVFTPSTKAAPGEHDENINFEDAVAIVGKETADQVTLGATPPSFDKQPVRDYAASLGWDKTAPAPPMPDEVIAATSARYIEAYEKITGLQFSDWPG